MPATAFNDLFGGTGTSDAMRAQFVHFTEAGATVKPIPDPPLPPPAPSGDRNYQGWLSWIQGHPDNPYTDVPQITRSPLRIPQFRNTTPYTGTGPMTDAEIAGFQDFRANYRASLTNWMDDQGVDAVVFPGELSDIHLNDSIQPSFGRRDPQASAAGVPTSIFPAGVNDHGQPIDLQLEGRPYSDPQMVAYAYAFEAKANGHIDPTATTPPLKYDPAAQVAPVASMTPAPAPITTTPSVASPPAVITEGAPAKPAASTPSGAATSFRRFTLLHRSLTANAKGHFRVQVGCASEQRSCTGTVVVRRAGVRVISRRVTVPAGHSATVTVTASPAVRRSLSRHRKVTFTVAVTGSGTTRSSTAVSVRVRRG